MSSWNHAEQFVGFDLKLNLKRIVDTIFDPWSSGLRPLICYHMCLTSVSSDSHSQLGTGLVYLLWFRV